MSGSYHDLPATAFPFTVQLVRADTQQVVWETRVSGPGVIHVPGMAAELGVPVMARLVLPDGHVIEEGPLSA